MTVAVEGEFLDGASTFEGKEPSCVDTDSLSDNESNSNERHQEKHKKDVCDNKRTGNSLDAASEHRPRPNRRDMLRKKPKGDGLARGSDYGPPRRPKRTGDKEGEDSLDRASDHSKSGSRGRGLPQRTRSAKSSRSPARPMTIARTSSNSGSREVRALPERSLSNRRIRRSSSAKSEDQLNRRKQTGPDVDEQEFAKTVSRDSTPRDSGGDLASDGGDEVLVEKCPSRGKRGGEGEKCPSRQGSKRDLRSRGQSKRSGSRRNLLKTTSIDLDDEEFVEAINRETKRRDSENDLFNDSDGDDDDEAIKRPRRQGSKRDVRSRGPSSRSGSRRNLLTSNNIDGEGQEDPTSRRGSKRDVASRGPPSRSGSKRNVSSGEEKGKGAVKEKSKREGRSRSPPPRRIISLDKEDGDETRKQTSDTPRSSSRRNLMSGDSAEDECRRRENRRKATRSPPPKSLSKRNLMSGDDEEGKERRSPPSRSGSRRNLMMGVCEEANRGSRAAPARAGSRRNLLLGVKDEEDERPQRTAPVRAGSRRNLLLGGDDEDEKPLRRKGGLQDRRHNSRRNLMDNIDKDVCDEDNAGGRQGTGPRSRTARRDRRELMRSQYAAAVRYNNDDDGNRDNSEEEEDKPEDAVADDEKKTEDKDEEECDLPDCTNTASSSKKSIFGAAVKVASKAAKTAVKTTVKSTTQVANVATAAATKTAASTVKKAAKTISGPNPRKSQHVYLMSNDEPGGEGLGALDDLASLEFDTMNSGNIMDQQTSQNALTA
ncbi:expressed unknown protein [Seminavis robusta]|uniref:Uncharacterized protein n=1 Tax=Seminavis robusta TaxID=568900 RepID=A0A9N8EWG3_9STRA|nr:expressed unknown protein [Seminavis robusta]|eukprot:Sro2024_g311580.1 n/a (767) ;mRNA; f:781-3081